MEVRVGPQRKLNSKELMPSNSGTREDSWESLGQQGDHKVSPKGNQPWIAIEGLMLKLKLQCFGHLMWRADSLEKILMLGKIEDRRKRGVTEGEIAGWHHQLDGCELEWTPGVGDGQGRPGVLQSMGSQRTRHDRATELINSMSGFFTSGISSKCS